MMDLFRLTLQEPGGGRTVALDSAAYVPESSDGFGLPPLQRYQERSPAQHGTLDRGFYILPRRLTFCLTLRANSAAELAERRAFLQDVLRPHTFGTPALLLVTLPDESSWSLAVFCTKLTFSAPRGTVQSATFELNAPNPAFSQHVSPTGLVFQQAEINTTRSLIYSGSWSAVPYPITLRGPLTHPLIRNLTADMKLDLDVDIPAGQTVIIDLREGYKTILSGSSSLLHCLSSDSDLESFCLLPAPEAPQGLNLIQVNGTNSGEATRVSLSYVPVRLGL